MDVFSLEVPVLTATWSVMHVKYLTTRLILEDLINLNPIIIIYKFYIYVHN